MDAVDLEKIDTSIVFYLLSAFFTVLTLAYFGFEYIQHLSAFTVSAILFGFFISSLLTGVNRNFIGFKITAYLASAGSYIVFYMYTTARFIETSNQILTSLIASALFFSTIGYILTNYKTYMPNKQQTHKIILGITGLLLALIIYNITMVGYDFNLTLEDEIEVVEGENMLGESEITKAGYLPIDINRERAQICFGTNQSNERLGSASIGGYMTGFTPETNKEELKINIGQTPFNNQFEEIEGLEKGNTYPIKRIDECTGQDLEEEVIGVAAAEAYSYPY